MAFHRARERADRERRSGGHLRRHVDGNDRTCRNRHRARRETHIAIEDDVDLHRRCHRAEVGDADLTLRAIDVGAERKVPRPPRRRGAERQRDALARRRIVGRGAVEGQGAVGDHTPDACVHLGRDEHLAWNEVLDGHTHAGATGHDERLHRVGLLHA